MAQTTAALAATDALIEYSTNGSDYTDISGYANSVTVSGGELQTGNAFTFDGDHPIIKAGKFNPITVDVDILFTESSTGAYGVLRGYFEAKTQIYLRWSPDGGAGGDRRFTTSIGYITNMPIPGGTAEGGDPLAVSMSFECADITPSDVPTS